MKMCPHCDEAIEELNISYYRKARKFYRTCEDEDGIQFYDEDEEDCEEDDEEDVFDLERNCPNCGEEIDVAYNQLEDYIDEDELEHIDYRTEYNKKKLKQEADKKKRQNKKLVNKLILNSIISSPSS